jgi:4-amino-4-deoxy-L-arabinose transferase-like glycosyltransferase
MRRPILLLVLLCVAAFLAATAIAYGVFQAVPHLEDEHANLFQAKVFASGKLYALSPAQPGAFFVPFVLDWGERRFSKYPPGYSLVLALGVLAHAPWLVNPLLGALALVAVFVLGRDLFDEETALIAAILAAASPMFLGLSSALLSHTLDLLLLTLFAWALIRSTLHAPHSTLYAFVAGLALGWAALTRPTTALAYAAPFGGWALWRIARRRAHLWPFVVTVLIAGALAALLPLYQWALTGDPWANLYASWWSYDQVGFGPNHGPLPEGHSLWNALVNANVDLDALFTDLYGWPGLSWVLFAPGLLMVPRNRREVALFAPLAALIVAYGFYWVHGSGIYGPRYWYEAMPFLWLLSARGLVKLWSWARGWRPGRSLVQIGLAALIALNVATTVPSKFALWRGLYFVTNEPWQAVQQAGLHNALVIVKGKLWTDYGAVLWANSLTLDGDLVFARDQGGEVNAAVIAQYPGRQVFWLEGARLTPMRGE